MSLKIVTNNQPREIIYGCDLPKSKRKDFDYIKDEDFDSNPFVFYREDYYDMGEFEKVQNNSNLKGWHGYRPDTYFSGILIQICGSADCVIMGRYFS